MRGWSDGTAEQVFTRGSGASGSDGRGAPLRVWLGVGGHPIDLGEDGCSAEALRTWVRKTQVDAGEKPGMTSEERARMKELEKENRELRRANEILRKASAYFARAELDRRPK